MLPTRKADQTRFNFRRGSAAAAWDTVKGIGSEVHERLDLYSHNHLDPSLQSAAAETVVSTGDSRLFEV